MKFLFDCSTAIVLIAGILPLSEMDGLEYLDASHNELLSLEDFKMSPTTNTLGVSQARVQGLWILMVVLWGLAALVGYLIELKIPPTQAACPFLGSVRSSLYACFWLMLP